MTLSRVGGVTLLRRVRALVLKRVSCGEEPNVWVTPSASRKAVFARLFVIVASWNVPGTLDGGNKGKVQLQFPLYSNRTFLGAQVALPEEGHHLGTSRAFLRRAWWRCNCTISDYR